MEDHNHGTEEELLRRFNSPSNKKSNLEYCNEDYLPIYDVRNSSTLPSWIDQNVRKESCSSWENIVKQYSFPKGTWVDCGSYWLNTSSQDSDDWRLNHRFRLTASNFGGAIGKSNFCTPVDVALSIINIKTKSPSDKVKFSAQHGVVTESEARDWYSRTRNVIVKEVGLAVPKWDPRIGASLDGDVDDGMIEIKSPHEMYKPLVEHMALIKSGWRPKPYYHAHIWDSHYAQMQGSMKITGKKWCDYIVYATQSNRSYVERVPFNQHYWDNELWPGIQNFLDNILEPLIAK